MDELFIIVCCAWTQSFLIQVKGITDKMRDEVMRARYNQDINQYILFTRLPSLTMNAGHITQRLQNKDQYMYFISLKVKIYQVYPLYMTRISWPFGPEILALLGLGSDCS